jgi:Chaperone for flagella basal body P-ring formation
MELRIPPPSTARLGAALALAATLALGGGARADTVYATGDTVSLKEILPVLAGSELGDLTIADAPPPGQAATILAVDVKRRLKDGGHDIRGLVIPKSTHVERRVQTVSDAELKERVTAVLAPTVAPCDIERVSSFGPLTLADGPFELSADTPLRRSSGRSTFSVRVVQGDDTRKLHGQIELQCPPPAVQAGSSVKLTVTTGAVRVSAPATAHQPGQPGDSIRVTSQLNRQSYLARIVDATTVELVR